MSGVSEPQTAEAPKRNVVRQVFRLCDLNRDNVVDAVELKRLLDVCGYDADLQYARAALEKCGTAGADGAFTADYREFVSLWSSIEVPAETVERICNGALEQSQAATRVQSVWRGRGGRHKAAETKSQRRQAQGLLTPQRRPAPHERMQERQQAQVSASAIQASWRGHLSRRAYHDERRHSPPPRSPSPPRSPGSSALHEKLEEMQLEEYEDRLRRVGVKRVGDLELLSPEDLDAVGMDNKFDRAALLALRPEERLPAPPQPSIALPRVERSAFAGLDGRERWLEAATRLFAQFSDGDESDGAAPQLTREGWAAMSRAVALSKRG